MRENPPLGTKDRSGQPVAVNWTGLSWASAVRGLRFTDCKTRGDEPHAKVIAIARTARKKTERPYFLIADLLPVRIPGKNSGMPAGYYLKYSLRSCSCRNQSITQLCAFCSPDRRKESANLCYGDLSSTTDPISGLPTNYPEHNPSRFQRNERICLKALFGNRPSVVFLTKWWSSVYHRCHWGVDCLPWRIQSSSAPVFFRAR
jgi:hypothetical protein